MRKPCCDKQDTNKGAWSKQEDQRLIEYIKAHGEGCWRTLPKAAGLLRCGKSCRLRWINYLRPDIKRGDFSEDEDDLIIKLHALLGNRWSLIAGRLPGRTDNEVKNYWNSHLRRKLLKMGIDPNNHRLNQIIPRAQNSRASIISTSSGSRDPVNMPMKVLDDNQRRSQHFYSELKISNTGSCLDDGAKGLPDLNLEIGLAISSPSISIVDEKRNHKFTTSSELDYVPPPTLFLFS